MVKKLGKKVTAGLLTFVMMLSMLFTVPVYAEVPEIPTFENDKTYAIVASSTGNALQVRETGWGDSAAVHVDGSISNGKVKAKSAFHIKDYGNNQYSFASVANDETLLKCEDQLGKGISFVFNWDKNAGDNHKFTVEPVNNGFKLKIHDTYLGLGENDRLEKVSEDDAEVFTFQEVSIINEIVWIEHVKTGRVLTFDNVTDSTDKGTVYVKDVDKNNLTDNEKFTPLETTNNDVAGVYKNTISFKSKSQPNFVLGSEYYEGGATIQVGAYNKPNGGGWEAVAVIPMGNGQVVFRDPQHGKLITVAEDGALVGNIDGDPAEGDLFVVHSEVAPSAVEDLTADDKTRTETTVDLSWTNPIGIYTDIQLYQKADNEELYTKLDALLTDQNKCTVENLKPGMKYTFKLVFVNGNGDVENANNPRVESNEVSIKTRAGVAPATPSDVVLKEKDKQHVTISWKAAENATHYQIMRADSRFGEYKDVLTVDKNTLSADVVLTNPDKYKNYYRVVALNNGAAGDEDFSGAERSEESMFVSLETNLLGDNVIIFAPTDDPAKIDNLVVEIFKQQNDASQDAQFNTNRYAIYYKQGDYRNTSCVPVGFYTHIGGLGKTPYDVQLNNIEVPAYLDGTESSQNSGFNYWQPEGGFPPEAAGVWRNATCNFWRSAENLSVTGVGDATTVPESTPLAKNSSNWAPSAFNWSVAQAAPLRRVYSTRAVRYDWSWGWASGGYTADCKFVGQGTKEVDGQIVPTGEGAGTPSGQQYFTRNTEVTYDAYGTTLNNFNMGVEAPNLPTSATEGWDALENGNGYSNWNYANDEGKQSVITSITKTPKVKEKPFLFIDDDGEYKVFVPSMRTNSSGVSWSEDDMGDGKVLSLSSFYIAKEGDSAATINKQLENGKNIFFTPGVYHAEEVIKVNNPNTILLGTGMASIIPDNEEGAMKVADVDGVTVSGLIFDAGTHSKYLLTVGNVGEHTDHSNNPTLLQDLFFRVGGTTSELTKADDALIINSDDVISDHFWIWRADHGAGVEWNGNESYHGIIVNGDDVTCYALFNEHFKEYDTLWNGENGATYFYQNEKCYDPISQDDWMAHDADETGNKTKGYAAYKVSNGVQNHYAVGLGSYNVFIYTGPEYDASKVQIELENAIEVPNAKGVLVENACIQTFAKSEGVLQKFNHIINGVGAGVSSGIDSSTGEAGEGWSRKFLIKYNNGTAVVGKTPGAGEAGNYIGVDTVKANQVNNDSLDISKLQELVNKKFDKDLYTSDSWKVYTEALNEGKEQLALAKLSQNKNGEYVYNYTTQKYIDLAHDQLDAAIKGLVKLQVVDKSQLQATYDKAVKLTADKYTEESWKEFANALSQAKGVLDNENATQKEVDNANKELKDAMAGLKEKGQTSTQPGDDDKKPNNPGNSNGDNNNPGNSNTNNGSQNQGNSSTNNGSQNSGNNNTAGGNALQSLNTIRGRTIVRNTTTTVRGADTSTNPNGETQEATTQDAQEVKDSQKPLSNGKETVKDNETPLAGNEGNWSVINLIVVIATVLLGIINILVKNEKAKQDNNRLMQILGAVMSVVSVIVFVLVEDLSLSMVMVDQWTILFVVFMVVNIALLVVGYLGKGKNNHIKPQAA